MPGGSVTSRLGFCGLDEGIGGLDATVGELRLEGVEDALPVVLKRLGDLLDRFEAAAASPAVPAIEEDLGVGRGLGGAENFAQAFLDAKSAVGFEVEVAEIDELDELLATPIVLVFQPDVATALELGDGLDLLATDLVDGLVDQLDDMELIEGDRGPWNMFALRRQTKDAGRRGRETG